MKQPNSHALARGGTPLELAGKNACPAEFSLHADALWLENGVDFPIEEDRPCG
jgi:hypothetical protein